MSSILTSNKTDDSAPPTGGWSRRVASRGGRGDKPTNPNEEMMDLEITAEEFRKLPRHLRAFDVAQVYGRHARTINSWANGGAGAPPGFPGRIEGSFYFDRDAIGAHGFGENYKSQA